EPEKVPCQSIGATCPGFCSDSDTEARGREATRREDMEQADETLLSVVVLELGATWPPWLAEYQTQAPNSMVIVQSADESATLFAQRINRKMDEVRARDAAIHAGLLVCNGALDAASIAARQAMCAALLRVMLIKQRG